MSDGFYRAFEERYRGSRELIKGRLGVYLPFIEPLLEAYPIAEAIDLGCGRGEWLELLVGSGFKPMGVDLDTRMLEVCHELGLPAEQGDAVAYLSALPDESQAVVSAFHVVEHITFEQLQILVAEALRVLKPGGLLIMETPNPENIVVATCNFYLDPTHQRPVPSMLLAFVAEYVGFGTVKTLRLQESKELVNKGEVSLRDVLAGASPDYAVIAQKDASDDVLALTSGPFRGHFGLSLEELLSRWDGRFDRSEIKAQQAEIKAQQAEIKAQQAEIKAQQAEVASNERLAQLQALYDSTSWKVTKPLRAIKRLLAGYFSAPRCSMTAVKIKVKQCFRPLLSSSIGFIVSRPVLRKISSPMVMCFPALHRRLLNVAINTRVVVGVSRHVPFGENERGVSSVEFNSMPPRARQVYRELKAEIEKKKKGAA